jgi:phosphoribosylglycinamide formyltransferase-1
MEGRDPVVVVLISGSGSNLQALIDAYSREEIPGKISAVISNKPDAYGLERAKQADIATHVIEHQKFAQREIFDAELIKTIDKHQPDLVVLAGFMRILTEDFVRRYEGRMLNIHPSLLPKYPGLHTHRRALEAKDKEHGVSVHFVTAELDSGPNIIQAVVPVLNQDNEETLATRVLEKEHVIYPIAVKWFIDGRLEMKDNHAFLDGEQLPESGLQLEIEQTLH